MAAERPRSSVITGDHVRPLHGARRRRQLYLNAAHYSEEIVQKYDLREFLLQQYTNFEQISVRRVAGVSPIGMDCTFRMPIIGWAAKTLTERMLHRLLGHCLSRGILPAHGGEPEAPGVGIRRRPRQACFPTPVCP